MLKTGTARALGVTRGAIMALTSLVLLSACAASDNTLELGVDDAWVRPVPLLDGLSEGEVADINSAAYMVLRNPGAEADRLVGATTSVARAVELHHSTLEDGVMRMREVETIEVPERGETRLDPGGFHLMLIGVSEPLEEGGEVTLHLHFERAGEIQINAPIVQR